ncbi:NAD(P)H-binding protein [Massilibacteroides vaginae]|uniref:NAD(P)H-binding protein n=1 Tax=Massilibacteroides vaginae TaxID=1673718 RepID=UPI000A1CF23A|nr:NAD(P)H-binding protein [Massilibacteroides vaginae]
MEAIIIGGSGATGAELLQLLLKDQAVNKVIALVRKPLRYTHEKLEQAVVDFNNYSSWAHLVKGDVAFSCMGTTLKVAGSKEAQYQVDYHYQLAFARAAKENHVPTFLLISSSSANPRAMFFYARMKGELEQAVESMGFKSFIIFRPGPLIRPETDRKGEKIAEHVIRFFNSIGLFRGFRPLPVKELAYLMLHYASNPPSGQHVLESDKILSEISFNELSDQ